MRQAESSRDTVQRRNNSCLREAFVFFLWHTSRHQPIAVIGGRCRSRADNLQPRTVEAGRVHAILQPPPLPLPQLTFAAFVPSCLGSGAPEDRCKDFSQNVSIHDVNPACLPKLHASGKCLSDDQWRRQLWGTGARAPSTSNNFIHFGVNLTANNPDIV